MGAKTGIEWTDATWNPIRGCTRVSEGCRNCYAERVAARFSGPGAPFEGLAVLKNGQPRWTGAIQFVEKHLLDPLKWKAPRRIFVNSMSDLFHEGVTDEVLCAVFKVMCEAKRHTFQVLTKRPERMKDFLTRWASLTRDFGPLWPNTWPQRHVWLGVSVENQKAADERIPLLLNTPAALRFLSCEPLLGKVRLPECTGFGLDCPLEGIPGHSERPFGGIDWVICGGESGPHARPMHPDWARSLRDQCQAAGVPFFFKQWGEWKPMSEMPEPEYDALYVPIKKAPEEWQQPGFDETYGRRCTVRTEYMNFGGETGLNRGFHVVDGHGGMTFFGVGKHAAGALLDGVEHKAFPEVRA